MLRIIYVGQLIPLKNVDALIQAVRALSVPAELTIAGDGEERQRLEALAGDAENIRFTGWLERSEAINRTNEADTLVMVSSPETYGLVYLESMARGCINIASRGEGFDGIINDGENGFLLPPGEAEPVTELLERIVALSDEERNRLIDAGYATALAMTEDQTTRMFLDANIE